MEPAVVTIGLTRRFKTTLAVNDLSLTVPRLAIYGFLGANGAGKTTAIKLILGLLRPDAGSIRLFGIDCGRGRPRIGALMETPALYPHLTGRENLDLTRRLLGLPASEVDRVLEVADLRPAAGRRVGGYSLGMRQRLGIARALLGEPRLLILDEPTNGLDPDGIRDMRALLRRLPETGDVTLLVSSHLLAEVEQVATHVGLIHRGRLLAEAPLGALLGGDPAVEVEASDPDTAAGLLRGAGLSVAPGSGRRLLLTGGPEREADPRLVARLLVEGGQDVIHLAERRRTLETVYHDHLARAAAA